MITENELANAVLFVALLIPSIIFHEVAHGWVAERLGDPTARRAGRITLNPVPHIDPVGSLLVPAVLAATGLNVIGWARPVPVDPGFFRHRTRDMALSALAGPGTNLTLAFLAARLGPFVDLAGAGSAAAVLGSRGLGVGITTAAPWGRLLFAFMVLNVALAVFNMLPIPPLDGSRLVPLVLPTRAREGFERLAPYGFVVLLALVLVFDGALDFLTVAIRWVLGVLI